MSNTISDTIRQHMTREPDSYRQEGYGGRSIAARWLLRENADGSKEYAVLYVSHWGAPQKCYRASINRTQVEAPRGDSPLIGETSAPLSAVEVLREPAARFSAKNLKAFTAKAVAFVRDPANHERFAAKFDADIPAAH